MDCVCVVLRDSHTCFSDDCKSMVRHYKASKAGQPKAYNGFCETADCRLALGFYDTSGYRPNDKTMITQYGWALYLRNEAFCLGNSNCIAIIQSMRVWDDASLTEDQRDSRLQNLADQCTVSLAAYEKPNHPLIHVGNIRSLFMQGKANALYHQYDGHGAVRHGKKFKTLGDCLAQLNITPPTKLDEKEHRPPLRKKKTFCTLL